MKQWRDESWSYQRTIIVWGEINYPFANFNDAAIEIWEWKSNFTPHFTESIII